MACVPEREEDLTFTRQDDYRWRNFVRTIDYEVPQYYEARSLDDLVWIANRAEADGRRLKATGSRWSIEDIATSRDWVVDISNLDRTLDYLVERGPGAGALTDYWRRRQFGDSDNERLVHVEAGIKIIDLNRRLQPRLAMPTLGGSQGQTLAGAISTSTHGSDFEHPPLCDLIEAVHLVTTNGEEVWIESSSRPLTRDNESLLGVLPCPETRIIRDDDALNAVVCGMGRFGIIYACVVRVTGAFRLSEWTQHLDWADVSAALASGVGRGPLDGSPFGSINGLLSDPPWDLRIATSPTDYRYFDLAFNTRKMDQCWVRRRWLTREEGDLNLEAGDNVLCHETVGNLILAAAAASLDVYATGLVSSVVFAWKAPEVYAHSGELKNMALDPHMTGGAALAAIVNAIARSEIFGGELSWLVDEMSQMALSGEFEASMTEGKRGPNWQVTSGVDETAFRPDCYNGSSIELVFGLQTRAYIDFIDEIRARAGDFVQVGYVSVRFSRGSRALLSMHHVDHPVACAIEVVSLRGLSGTGSWLRWLLQRGQEMGGRPHWGQQHDLRSWEVASLYGSDALTRWRAQLLRIAGTSTTFSNGFTTQRGLEPVGVRRRVTAVRQERGAITHLCNEEEHWSPVPVEIAVNEISYNGIVYFVAAPDGTAEQPVLVRRVLTTAPDDTTENNLGELPHAPGTFPPPDTALTELVVTSVIRSTGTWPTIRYLCNEEERWCVPREQAFLQIRAGTHAYYVGSTGGTRAPVEARQYLTTAADETTLNNLDSLPSC